MQEWPKPMQEALPILERLLAHGYEAVFVGGCVRDALLGRELSDVDIAVSARPEQVMELFERTIPTGLQHGTVTVLWEKRVYELTTYRTESQYEGHRRPEEVIFVSELQQDLLRRDFTMNAIALSADGQLIDPYGGQADLGSKVLRCVGDPDARLQEDALRMLRAVRFAAEFSMSFTDSTWQALLRHRALLRYMAMERVRAELHKMIVGSMPTAAVTLLASSELLSHTKEELPSLQDSTRLKAFLAAHPAALEQLSEPIERWSCLFIGAGASPSEAEGTLHALRFASKDMKQITAIIRIHAAMSEGGGLSGDSSDMTSGVTSEETSEETSGEQWADAIIQFGRKAAYSWLQVERVLMSSKPDHSAAAPMRLHASLDKLSEVLEQMPVSTMKELRVSGRQLAARLDREAGKWTGEWLQRLLKAAALQQVANETEALLHQAELWQGQDTERLE